MPSFLRNALKGLYRSFLGLLPDPWAVQGMYFLKFRRFADLRAPATFNEKINWRKLHQRDPRFTLFADKAAVKDEIARLVGEDHVIPTLWTGERPEDIPYDRLIPPYVIKTNHGYSGHVFIRRAEDIDKAKINADLNRLLRHSHGRTAREWAYYGIPRKIIVERMLDLFSDDEPEDYKFFVYHGRVHFIQLGFSRLVSRKRVYYDRSWNKLDIATAGRLNVDKPVPPPATLGKMLEIAEKIGSLFDFVRVDLYSVEGRVYFGETTFYPSGGYARRSPEIWDLKFGEPWILPAPKG